MTGETILFYFLFCCCLLCILSESFLKFTTLFPSDYLPYGSGGNDEFWEDTPAHSPSVNVVGAVTATGLKLPLLFLDGPFNQVVYLDWLQNVAIPFLEQRHPHRGVLFDGLRWQHDGHRSHTTAPVRNNEQHFQHCLPYFVTTFCLQVIKYLGQVFDGRLWSLKSRRILSDIDRPAHLRQPHPHWRRALEFPPYTPDKALMDFCVWPLVDAEVCLLNHSQCL